MGSIIPAIKTKVIEGVKALYNHDAPEKSIQISITRKEFEGDYTVIVFPFTRAARKNPEAIGSELGAWLLDNSPLVTNHNTIKGFLNLSIDHAYWHELLDNIHSSPYYGTHPSTGKKVLVEFSSPNTNKPLHLGHIRNILLGWSCSKILKAAGNEVYNVQVINDRGIAICKSMLAWQLYGEGKTPASEGIKGDHFVGGYYVLFNTKLNEEYKAWQTSPKGKEVYQAQAKPGLSEKDFFSAYKNEYFNTHSKLGAAAKNMLLKWEAGETDTISLWEKMNNWVYQGFDATYEKMGVNFDKLYYESDTYLLGKDLVKKGLEEGVFYQKSDNSVWIDLEAEKLDHKIVLRSDGTSVYMTQDIGTAELRYKDFGADSMVYVVADEQNYHFQVLFSIMKKLNAPYADELYHLSYGMVHLTTGTMKSREGTVVDADDLMKEVVALAASNAKERGGIAEVDAKEQADIFNKIGLGALKFFILKVNPRKTMIFDPEESVDMQGHTGPYIQNAYVRIQSIFRKLEKINLQAANSYKSLHQVELDIVKILESYPQTVKEAAEQYDPSHIASYCYDLAKAYHKFYAELSIMKAENEAAQAFRLKLSNAVGKVLATGLDLLGIEPPQRM